jgi:hypothetical protein
MGVQRLGSELANNIHSLLIPNLIRSEDAGGATIHEIHAFAGRIGERTTVGTGADALVLAQRSIDSPVPATSDSSPKGEQ